MSKHQKKKNAQGGTLRIVVAAVAVLALVILAVALIAHWKNGETPATQPSNKPAKVETSKKVNINLGYGMYIREVAKYTGIYMEDGSDEIVSGVLMIVVENTGDTDVQLAEIEMPVGKNIACFKLTTLPAGESIVLLDTNRMDYVDVDYTTAIAKNVVLFNEPLNLYEDQLKIQILNGAINITNISGEDITGDIVIYYKNASSDLLYGGITYRVTITGGIKAGDIKQITGSHFSAAGSRIMWATVG